MRVSASVDPLVVREHDLGDRAVHPEVPEHVGAELGMLLDRHPILVGQRPPPLGDAIRQREVADVVQQPGGVRQLLLSCSLIPTDSAMSRANRATAAACRAARCHGCRARAAGRQARPRTARRTAPRARVTRPSR